VDTSTETVNTVVLLVWHHLYIDYTNNQDCKTTERK